MRHRTLTLLALAAVLTLGVSMAQAQSTKVIKIASQSPLSGGQSEIGTGIRNGVELAISQLAGPLKDQGFDVQFVPYDDQATPDVGVANAQQIVADPAILAVIGHYNSGVAIPSSEVYDKNDLVMVSPANTNPTVTDRGLPTVNRVCGRDDTQAAAAVGFIQTLTDVKSVYVLHDTTTYGQGIAQFVNDELIKAGYTVLGFEGTTEKANFDSIIQPILAQTPDMIYFGGMYDQVGIFVNQLRTAGFTGKIMGPDGIDSPDLAKLGGDGAVGVYYSSPAGHPTAFPNAKQFVIDYTAKYSKSPTPYSAQAYDATGIVLKAIEAAVAAANGEMPTRKAVAEAVRAAKDYAGLSARLTFDKNGDPELASYYIYQVDSSDPARWNDAPQLVAQEVPSPLVAALEAAATPEATPAS